MTVVQLPYHLRTLAGVTGQVEVEGETVEAVVDALEEAYPGLRGTVRDPATRRRRAFVRFYACQRDLSHEPPTDPLPAPVLRGEEPLRIIGAMAGG